MGIGGGAGNEDALRAAGLRATAARLAVLDALAAHPHAGADRVLSTVRAERGLSVQGVYDVLADLTEHGLLRRLQPAGSVARYELRVGDNHHHVVCRSCGAVADIDCVHGSAPCLAPKGVEASAPGFVVDEAEVTWWGTCAACRGGTVPMTTEPTDESTTDTTGVPA